MENYPFLLSSVIILRNRDKFIFLLKRHPHPNYLHSPSRHFPFFSFLVSSALIPPHTGNPTLPAPHQPAVSQNKLSSPVPLLDFSFTSSSNRSPHLSSLSAFTMAPFSLLSKPLHSSRKQRRSTRSPTYCRRLTHICPILPLMCTFIEHFSSIPLSPLPYIIKF